MTRCTKRLSPHEVQKVGSGTRLYLTDAHNSSLYARMYDNMYRLVINIHQVMCMLLAGCSNCPYYARTEMLADQLSANLPDFRVKKIVRLQIEWQVGWQYIKLTYMMVYMFIRQLLISNNNEYITVPFLYASCDSWSYQDAIDGHTSVHILFLAAYCLRYLFVCPCLCCVYQYCSFVIILSYIFFCQPVSFL